MKDNNMQNISTSGDIYQELNEIKKMQKEIDSILSAITNTCSGIRTIICC